MEKTNEKYILAIINENLRAKNCSDSIALGQMSQTL
jgi:hypothetical protein